MDIYYDTTNAPSVNQILSIIYASNVATITVIEDPYRQNFQEDKE